MNKLTTITEDENKSDQVERPFYQAANVNLQFFNKAVPHVEIP